jgi:Acetokinase family/Phosphate acetyl/butaryl transferase
VLEGLAERGLLNDLAAVGHRVVHGDERFSSPVLVTPEVLVELESISQLAPLHNPVAVLGMRVALARLAVPQVAVLDTAFYQTMPPLAYLYAVPMSLYRDHGVRRYGFHGTSHRYVAAENSARIRAMTACRLKPLGLVLDEDANLRMVGSTAGVITRGERPVAAVINTNEEWMIARDIAIQSADSARAFDAVSVESVGRQKAPGSQVAGRATVFVFPDLNTGNTTYKAVQRSAHVVSVGPMLQGLRKPVNDLSRGALVDVSFTRLR